MILLIHEWKRNRKTLLIWALSVGLLCGGCLLLFRSLEESMAGMAEAYAEMGAFSTALGMDKISVSTMEGFYAAEIGLMFALGGAMFAALTGASIVAKEEEGHTAEFLHALPLGRGYIIGWKYGAMILLILAFHVICLVCIGIGFLCAGQYPPAEEFVLYHGAQLLMQLEVGSLCFLLSAVSGRRQTGGALGLAMLLYAAELLARVLPKLEKLKYITPYYFSNATDIFTAGKIDPGMALLSLAVTVAAVAAAAVVYERRDLR